MLKKKLNFRTLESLCLKITDGSHYSPKPLTNGVPMLSVKDMGHNCFSYDDCKLISEEDYKALVKADCKPLKNDILIAKDGSYLKHVFVVEEEIDQAILSSIGILRPNLNLVNPYYIKYYLHSDFVKREVSKKYVSGSALPRIILKNFGQIEVPYVEKELQDKIVKVLRILDSKIELNTRINAELEAMARLIYDYWFVQFDFPDANDKPYRSSGGKMVYNQELKREIPEGWNKGTLADIGDIIGGSTPSTTDAENFTNNGTPWITPKDLSLNIGNRFISRGETDVTEKGIRTASLKLLPKGTVLMSSRAPIGYLAIARVEVTTNQGFKSFVPKDGYSTEFVFLSVERTMPAIVSKASGSTFKEVSGGVLKSVETVLPAKDIIKAFTNKVEPIFEKQDILEQENQQLSELRDWLLPMLMNGQVTVGEAEEKVAMAAEVNVPYGQQVELKF
jgi:type I restriction enzyme S subunit